MVYDLLVVGSGLAAQTFWLEFLKDKKCQNLRLAQLSSETIAPACSLRSTATVSLSGIEEGISDLGDELRTGFYLFEKFVNEHSPPSVQAVSQFISFSNDYHREKLTRRYNQLIELNDISHFKQTRHHGMKLQSFLINPSRFLLDIAKSTEKASIDLFDDFLSKIEINSDGVIECTTLKKLPLKARRILFCTGAYSKIFSHFYFPPKSLIHNTQVSAGAYLTRQIDLGADSFFFTLDGHNLIYRFDKFSSEKTLMLGSATERGAISAGNLSDLSEILESFQSFLNIDLGKISDYKMIEGLRHKGIKRRPMVFSVDESKKIIINSGLYKNGYTLAFHNAKKCTELFSTLL